MNETTRTILGFLIVSFFIVAIVQYCREPGKFRARLNTIEDQLGPKVTRLDRDIVRILVSTKLEPTSNSSAKPATSPSPEFATDSSIADPPSFSAPTDKTRLLIYDLDKKSMALEQLCVADQLQPHALEEITDILAIRTASRSVYYRKKHLGAPVVEKTVSNYTFYWIDWKGKKLVGTFQTTGSSPGGCVSSDCREPQDRLRGSVGWWITNSGSAEGWYKRPCD